MSKSFLTDYGTYSRLDEILSLVNQRHSKRAATKSQKTSLIAYKDETAAKTVSTASNGLSRQEVERLCNASRFMEKTGQPLYWAVIGNGILDLHQADARRVFDRFQANLAQAQKRAGYLPYWLSVFEATAGIHANFVFIGDEKLSRRLCRSFSDFMQSGYGEGNAMQPVHDAVKLASHYLSKERTVQCNYALRWSAKTRLPGSHRIEGGGDRVRLSAALRIDALAAGAVEPWKATRASRASR